MTYQETAYQKTNIVDDNGNVINSFGSSGGGGDASATNQQSQIQLETAIRDRLNPIKQYVPSDLDDSGGYYGFVDTNANWYIQKITTTTIRYVSGTTGYISAWNSRTTQTYDYFYNVF